MKRLQFITIFILLLALSGCGIDGSQGEQGIQGVQGEQGEEGIQGEQGEDGLGIATSYILEDHLIVEYTDGAIVDLGLVVGQDGAQGQAGLDGQSAYEIYTDANPGYVGTEEEWLLDLINGILEGKEEHTVTFITGTAEVIEPLVVAHGENISDIPEPLTKLEHEFVGWYLGDEEWSFIGNGVYQDITLTAKWIVNQYSIQYYMFPDGYDTVSSIPLQIGETISQIESFANHSSAISSEARVFTWGRNLDGRLGDGTTIQREKPIEITSQFDLNDGETIVQISLGFQHSSALSSDGRVFTWGVNYFGQLGDGTTTERLVPTEITSQFVLGAEETITQMELGEYHSSAITSEGRLFTWGRNSFGQLGDGTTTERLVPTEITSQFELNEEDAISLITLGRAFSLAITTEGRVFTWGRNSYGELGDGTAIDKHVPTDITSFFAFNPEETVIQIASSFYHSSVITSEGRVFMWGYNFYGQCGDGTTTNKLVPTEIESNFDLIEGETVIQLSLGGNSYSIARTSKRRVFVWGNNEYGQLGDGTTIDKYVPTEITSNFDLNENETIIQVSLGEYHSIVMTSNGRILTWGSNTFGQLGIGTTTWKTSPTVVQIFVPKMFEIIMYDYNESIEYVPTRAGSIFLGWYIDQNLTIPYTSTTMPAKNLILYGRWVSN